MLGSLLGIAALLSVSEACGCAVPPRTVVSSPVSCKSGAVFLSEPDDTASSGFVDESVDSRELAVLLCSEFVPAVLYVDLGEGKIDLSDSLRIDGIDFSLSSSVGADGVLTLDIELANHGDSVFAPLSAGVRLPLDTYMESYPQWLDKWSPVYLDAQEDHFLGYAMTPSGRIKGIFSPQGIASWSLDYNLGYPDPLWFYGHRITSACLDLMHRGPLPSHHPSGLDSLAPGEVLSWKVQLVDIPSIEDFESYAFAHTDAPVLDIDKTSYSKGEKAEFAVFAHKPEVTLVSPSGKHTKLSASRFIDRYMRSSVAIESRGGAWHVSAVLPETGEWRIEVNDGGRECVGMLSVHRPWSEAVDIARQAAWDCPQKPTSHVESWYGFFSAFLAARTNPSPELDKNLDERFDFILEKLYTEEGTPLYFASRIQNTASTISMLVDRYKAYGRVEDLEFACKMADWLISSSQSESGAYMNYGTKYTSVIYVAKSILELSLAERDVKGFEEASHRHYASAQKAVEELVRSNGDFQTEGEQTFEDGMVSCSALQMGFLALSLQEGDTLRNSLTSSMLSLLDQHNSLTQLRVPDARRRGGTIRFWESQYDVLMLPDMICSPHGWSAWRAYATYYAYLLTGEEKWLLETWNAAGAFAGLISSEEVLRWAFVVDPYVKARQTRKPVPGYTSDSLSFGNPHPDVLGAEEIVVGEQYVDMVSSYQGINIQDNDVHEVFRFIGESFLENAFVVEREDGSLGLYNCHFEKDRLVPDEECINRIHFNLASSRKFKFNGAEHSLPAGMNWVEL